MRAAIRLGARRACALCRRSLWRLFNSPADYQQGETVRIMYVHVPAAWLAMMAYSIMAHGQRNRHHLPPSARRCGGQDRSPDRCSVLLSRARHRLDLGQAHVGRLVGVGCTAHLDVHPHVLLYLGYIAVWQAIDDPSRAAAIARIVALVGFVNMPIIKFSVDWWNSLHQPASVFRMGGPTIDASMLWPLLVMGLAYTLLFTRPAPDRHARRNRSPQAARTCRLRQQAGCCMNWAANHAGFVLAAYA